MRNSPFWNHFQEQGLFKQNTLSETICIKGQTPSEAECAEIAILQNLGNHPFVVFVFNMNNQRVGGVTKGAKLEEGI